MKLTILGCGTSYIKENHHESAYLLEHNGKKYLFDSGAGTVYQLLKLGIKVTEIDSLFYTHFHNDHISDLPTIMWTNNWDPIPREKTLTIYGPNKMKSYLNLLIDIMYFNTDKNIKSFKYPIKINEITNKEIKVDDLVIKTRELNHFNNIGYRIKLNNKIIVYTGDTAYCDEIIELSKDADICFIDCGVPDNIVRNHLTPTQCAIIAKKSKVKKLIIIHSYPSLDNVDIKEIIKKHYDGEITIAKDFMEFDL